MLVGLKALFTTQRHLSGDVTGSLLEKGMPWIYLQDVVIEKRGILLTGEKE